MGQKIRKLLMFLGFTALVKLFVGNEQLFAQVQQGSDERGSFEFEGLKRTYHLHIPANIDKLKKIPLVLLLHGRGGNGESMVLVTKKGFNKLADLDRFIVAYPDGIEFNWNDGRMDEEANDRAHRDSLNDVGFLSSLIDTLIKNYNADPKRVYVTGISNGAMMAYRLAAEISGKIAAIAPVDGNIPSELLPSYHPQRPVSLLAINNTNDPLVPFEGGDIIGGIFKTKLGKVISVEETIKFWVNNNKCKKTPVITEEPDRDPDDGTRIKREVYSGGKEGSEVILYTVNGGGHTWPGGFQYLPPWIIGKTSRDMDSNEVIWNFFKKHSR
jgi:polyhydroxybutyrate depolymerase